MSANHNADLVAVYIERAENAHDPAQGLVYAQIATVHQIAALTEIVAANARKVLA